jgi:hypothetical protein
MKAAGVWLVTVYKSWIKTSLKSGPGSSTQTDICRHHGTGPETNVRKCTFGKGFPTNNHNGMVKWCPECREDVRRQKENARLRAKREEKKRATTPSLGDSIVIVSKQRG